MKYKHLSFDDRLTIEVGLKQGHSFKQIATAISKNCTSVSREIRGHYQCRQIGSSGRQFNNCLLRKDCKNRNHCHRSTCPLFQEEQCPKLKKPPYVCNDCQNRNCCVLTKHLYDSSYAQKEYEEVLRERRSGRFIDPVEIDYLNELLVPLIKEQHQSIHHVFINHKNKIMHSESTLYSLIDQGILKVRNIDLPKKVRLRNRVKKPTVYKVDKQCRLGRTYEDYLIYLNKNPDTPIIEMDTFEGKKGGKVLLTIHFVSSSFMLAFSRNHNDVQSVIDVFNWIDNQVGREKFKELFPLLLTDNGSEFSSPKEIEFDSDTGEQRTQVYYCHPSSPYEKGSCEVNHQLLRRVFPKGEPLDSFTQEEINLIMSHINSYQRKKLNDKSPSLLFSTLYGVDTLEKLGITRIDPNNVSLSPKIINR